MTDKIAFCSVAITSQSMGDAYIIQQQRLKESILSVYPDGELLFWVDSYPEGAKPFLDSLYGFKPHAVQAALDAGFTKVVWCDTAIILHDKIDFYDEFMKEHGGVIAIQDDSALINVTSDYCLQYFEWDRPDLKDRHLVGGSFLYFDFEIEGCKKVFNKWRDAEQRGIFGSQWEESAGKLNGHRADETVLAMSLYYWGFKPFTHKYDTRYCTGAFNTIVTKKHFK